MGAVTLETVWQLLKKSDTNQLSPSGFTLRGRYLTSFPVAQMVKNLPVVWETRVNPCRKIPWRGNDSPPSASCLGESHGQNLPRPQPIGHESAQTSD